MPQGPASELCQRNGALVGLACRAGRDLRSAARIAMYLLRDATCFKPGAKAKPNSIWRIEDIATPEIAQQSGYVTPNVNVVYGFGFMDLGPEPVILSAPNSHGRYYMIEVCDMWTNAFAYPADGPSGYKGGTFALVGPDWQGDVPADAKRIDCPTRWIELQPRVFVKDEADLVRRRRSCVRSRSKGFPNTRAALRRRPPPIITKRRRSRRMSQAASCSSTIRCSSGRSSPRR